MSPAAVKRRMAGGKGNPAALRARSAPAKVSVAVHKTKWGPFNNYLMINKKKCWTIQLSRNNVPPPSQEVGSRNSVRQVEPSRGEKRPTILLDQLETGDGGHAKQKEKFWLFLDFILKMT